MSIARTEISISPSYLQLNVPAIESVNWTISVTINGFYFLARKTKQEIPENRNLCPSSSQTFYGSAHFLLCLYCFTAKGFPLFLGVCGACVLATKKKRIWFTYAICCSLPLPLWVALCLLSLQILRDLLNGSSSWVGSVLKGLIRNYITRCCDLMMGVLL